MKKQFIRQAKLPKGAYPTKTLEQVLAPYMDNKVTVECKICKQPMEITKNEYNKRWGKEFQHQACWRRSNRFNGSIRS